MANILIIDDDKTICDVLSDMVKHLGFDATSVLTLEDGVKETSTGTFDVVFLDVRMPDGSGLDALPEILAAPSAPEVIIMTGFGDPDGAELAIKSGAWDYIEKPFSMEKFKLPLIRVLEYRKAKKAGKVPVSLDLAGIVGSSPQIKACFDLLAEAAHSDVNVLITGETGTGKELFARAIHNNSHRADKSFVVVDCAALPVTLVESVLFGHEKGAFTGADKAQEGLIKQADGGTLFLDEVGELPMSVQKAFLRVLQERCFRPVGARREIKSNFRLVVATHRDLRQMMQSGQFRKDLLFRLESFTIRLLPLRERTIDIKELVLYYTAKLCESYEIETKSFSPGFLDTLAAYDWPGNVRELVNALETALVKARYEPTLFPKHLPVRIRIKAVQTSVSKESTGKSVLKGSLEPISALAPLRDFRMAAAAEAEKEYLKNVVCHTRGNIKDACRISGLGRARFYELLKKYNISRVG
ncbi:MAG: sigma-54-dependent Fis family transcriptional regulator [Deltaproteobacteria bacterium]|nr:sigma-54-dependent Fis family transcriptional regulator [Deltaproteobacteria bacterium]